jgi:hypothetical protein
MPNSLALCSSLKMMCDLKFMYSMCSDSPSPATPATAPPLVFPSSTAFRVRSAACSSYTVRHMAEYSLGVGEAPSSSAHLGSARRPGVSEGSPAAKFGADIARVDPSCVRLRAWRVPRN